RGYPTGSPDEREEMLSVDHSDVMDNYRAATDIDTRGQAGKSTTEDLRQAMQHYRTLFARLLGDALGADATTSGAATSDTYPAGTAGTRPVDSAGSRNVVDVTEPDESRTRRI